MARTPEQIAELRRRIEDLDFFYHAVDLGDGLRTPGHFDMAQYLEHYHFPDLRGKRVLDVGAASGFFSVEFEKRGAAEVVAIDLPGWESHDWTPRYLERYRGKPEQEKAEIDRRDLKEGFRILTDAFDSKAIRKVERRIYDLDPDELGLFDVVFCGSMLMHVRDPILGLQKMRGCCRPDGRLILSLSATMEDDPNPVARFVGEWDQCNWWQMNPECVRVALRCCDFETIENESRFVLEDTSGRFKDPTFVCHALPRQD